MQRRILSTACTAAFLCITLVPAAPAWAAERNTGAPSEAAPASTAAGVVKPPVAVPTDDFAPTAQLVSVHFDFASSAICPGEAAMLDRNAAWLRANPMNTVLVEGAADQPGNRAYNQALAERRARAVQKSRVALGAISDRTGKLRSRQG